MKLRKSFLSLPLLAISWFSHSQNLTDYKNIYLINGAESVLTFQSPYNAPIGSHLHIKGGNAFLSGSSLVSGGSIYINAGVGSNSNGYNLKGTIYIGDEGNYSTNFTTVDIGKNAWTSLGSGTGRVGIGSAHSLSEFKFTVIGSSQLNGPVSIGNRSTFAPGVRLMIGDLSFYGNETGDIVSTGSIRSHFSSSGDYSIFRGDVANRSLRMKILANGNTYLAPKGGNVVIGSDTATPKATLDVRGFINTTGDFTMAGHSRIDHLNLSQHPESRKQRALVHGWNDDLYINFNSDFEGGVHIQGPMVALPSAKLNIGATSSARISVGGNAYISNGLSIGTTDFSHLSNYKLSVNGKILAKGLKIQATGWADYVFDNDYQLLALDEVEAYINKNKHLPGVPSEATVLSNGIDLEDINKILLQKIEELTLYTIELNKKVKVLEESIQSKK